MYIYIYIYFIECTSQVCMYWHVVNEFVHSIHPISILLLCSYEPQISPIFRSYSIHRYVRYILYFYIYLVTYCILITILFTRLVLVKTAHLLTFSTMVKCLLTPSPGPWPGLTSEATPHLLPFSLFKYWDFFSHSIFIHSYQTLRVWVLIAYLLIGH